VINAFYISLQLSCRDTFTKFFWEREEISELLCWKFLKFNAEFYL
jgi:hypothetical protein